MAERQVLSTSPAEWSVGVSTSTLNPCTDHHFAMCSQAGIECIELTLFGAGVDASTPSGIETLAKRVEQIRTYGLSLWSVHLPFGHRWNIASPDADLLESVLMSMEKFLGLAAEWGAKVAVIHPGAEPIEAAERAEHFARSRRSLEHLEPIANRLGVKLAVECLPRTCLGNCSSEMIELLKGLDSLGVCYDANHPLQEPSPDFAAKLSGRIATVHISDYDGIDERHWLPGRGITDWSAVIRNLAKGGYAGPFLFEVSQPKEGPPITPQDLKTCWQRLLSEYLAHR